MADIRPFQGIRPAPQYAERVAALPYDVYSREEAAREAVKDRLSFLNIDRPETQFAPEEDMYAPKMYEKAREMLWEEIQAGIFQQEKQDCYYLYELTMGGRVQTGLVACASIDDYIGNVIKKHENTRAEKEADRIRHVDVCSAQTGPIFLAYRRDPVISEVTVEAKKQNPLFDFTAGDGVRHRGWIIREETSIGRIQEAFGRIGDVYIADGHHRTASAVRVGLKRRAAHPDYDGTEEFNYFLSILFPDDELMILDYNRVVKDLNGNTPEELLEKASEVFDIRELGKTAVFQECVERNVLPSQSSGSRKYLPEKPRKKGELLMFLADGWYHLKIKPQFRNSDPVDGLDVSILQKAFLEPVLGIRDPKNDGRIDFVGGIRGLAELERRVRTDCAVAFAMCPTSISELFEVADAGRLMPPKSTWFEPKLRSGLFIHKIEE